MAAKTTLNARNLETLGVKRLAELLIEISMGSAANKRRLRLELAGSQSVSEVAREVRKRLSSIDRSRTFVKWNRIRALKTDLETQRLAIADTIAKGDPDEAMDLLWRFLDMAHSIFSRCDDSNGVIVESFHAACMDLGAVARQVADRRRLPQQVFAAIQRNDNGEFNRLIPALAPALGKDGFETLKTLLSRWRMETSDPPADGAETGLGTSGLIDAGERHGRHPESAIRIALEQIANAEGDVDAFIAVQSDRARATPAIAAGIATRLLAAGRAVEALTSIDVARPTGNPAFDIDWQRIRATTLEAIGRQDEAQAFRWQCFEQQLNVEHAKAYVSRLPDFDDMEAEEQIFAHVQGFEDVHRALLFLVEWPAQAQAAKLILARADEIDGNFYETLTFVAEALQDKYPLAATVALRAMIDFALDYGRSGRYRHAARHLGDAGRLAAQIDDFGALRDHIAYVADLKAVHGRKHGFWSTIT